MGLAFGITKASSGGGGGGTTITTVANYSALPSAASVSGKFYWCEASQGTKWLPFSVGGTYYPLGMYYSNGVTWEFSETPYQATQSEVNTGTNTDKFVSPSTFTNASKWNSFVPYTGATSDVNLGSNSISARNFISSITSFSGSATPIILTSSSSFYTLITGNYNPQILKLPDATTLTNGTIFRINNNMSSGSTLIQDTSGNLISGSGLPASGCIEYTLIDNSTVNGVWDYHSEVASNAVWGLTNLAYSGSITSATWNGVAIGDSYISSASVWNAKQTALSGTGFVKISGTTISYDNSTYLPNSNVSGTSNYLPKFTGSSVLGNSQIQDNGTGVGIGSSPVVGYKLYVNGSIYGIGNSTNTYGVTGENIGDITGTYVGVYGGGIYSDTAYAGSIYVGGRFIGSSGTSINSYSLWLQDGTEGNGKFLKSVTADGKANWASLIATTPLSYNSTTNTFSIQVATTSQSGFLSSANWTTFNNKQDALTNLSGSSVFDFGNENDSVVNTILSASITNNTLKSATFVNVGTTETSLDDFVLNGVSFNIENIVDNVSFDIRATAINNASGNYTINYKILI